MNQVRAVTSVWLTLVCLHNTNWQTISSLTCFTTYHMTPVITWDDNIHTTLWGEHIHWPMNHMAFPVVGEERVLRVGTKRLVCHQSANITGRKQDCVPSRKSTHIGTCLPGNLQSMTAFLSTTNYAFFWPHRVNSWVAYDQWLKTTSQTGPKQSLWIRHHHVTYCCVSCLPCLPCLPLTCDQILRVQWYLKCFMSAMSKRTPSNLWSYLVSTMVSNPPPHHDHHHSPWWLLAQRCAVDPSIASNDGGHTTLAHVEHTRVLGGFSLKLLWTGGLLLLCLSSLIISETLGTHPLRRRAPEKPAAVPAQRRVITRGLSALVLHKWKFSRAT